MIELVIAAIIYIVLALALFYRVIKGPSVVDRVVAADSIDVLTSCALVLYSVYTGRSIYLDVAMIVAVLGFLSTLLIAKYLEGKL